MLGLINICYLCFLIYVCLKTPKSKRSYAISQSTPPENKKSEASEIERLRIELAKTKSDLDEFVYLASHDLKAPLNAMNSLADWLTEDIGSQISEESLKHLAMIKSSANRAKLLVSDLSLYSRIGNEIEEYEFIALNQLAIICTSQVKASKFRLDIEGCDLTLPKQSLISVLMQLISNAVKHHKSDSGTIRIICTKLTHTYKIEVSDDGPGINPRNHEKVFKKFQTLKSRDEVEGSGMGLALVEKTLGLYAAKITLVSDGQSGSSFIIEWPFASKTRES